MRQSELRELARVGAKARIVELEQEIAALRRLVGEGGANSRPKRRGRRKMSAAERRAVSRRMKAYWKKRNA
jgi:hypothetical protein